MPVPVAATCVRDAGQVFAVDPAQSRVVTGTNGTMTDACNAAGDLVKATCAQMSVCGSGVNPLCKQIQTGIVEQHVVDCAGMCAVGTCASGCPVTGDALTVTSTDGSGGLGFSNQRDQRHYACTLLSQISGAAADCATSLLVGAVQYVTALGLHGTFCTGKSFGNVAIGPDPTLQSCTLTCDIAP